VNNTLGRYNISLNDELIAQIDKAAQVAYMGRSDFIREAVLERLRTMPQNIALEPLTDEALTDQWRRVQRELAARGIFRDPITKAYVRGKQRSRKALYRGGNI
jgi:Arc/MetJ-type ribon-helix-helix transcriptional regulator